MTPEKLKILEHKFVDYADKYILASSNPAPLTLKKEHTLRVCDEIEAIISNSKTLSNSDKVDFSINFESHLLARAIALFHDIGRFRQFETYGTFLDGKSVNHAGLSIVEIDNHNILSICSEREKYLIKGAIAVHNASHVPKIADNEMVFYMKALRDADKLDIWRVVINNYNNPDAQSKEIVNLGLQDNKSCSEDAINSIINHTYVNINYVKELNDLKLMQISWVFDLNFHHSLLNVKKRRYIEQLVATLSVPKDYNQIASALESVYDYIETNL